MSRAEAEAAGADWDTESPGADGRGVSAERSAASAVRADLHEHGWCVESRHATSQGWILYVRCGGCGVRRVDLLERAGTVPAALSAAVASSC